MVWTQAFEHKGYFWIKRDWKFWASVFMIFLGGFLLGISLK